MFYHFRQNNSFGEFQHDAEKGIGVDVVIEAESADEANAKAEKIGLYFDHEYEIDCSCCGTRWSEVSDEAWYAKESFDRADCYGSAMDVPGRPWGYVHYADGRVEAIS